MKQQIEELADELYRKVLTKWRGKKDKAFFAYLDDALSEYNKKTAHLIETAISSHISQAMAQSLGDILLTGVHLSSRLHKNAEYVQKQVLRTINDHIQRGETIGVMERALFDGYNPRQKDILQIKKGLPKYLFGNIDRAKIEAMQRKTKSLRSAYLQMLKHKDDASFQKSMEVALKEKSRYYAARIADTEEQRAFNIANSKEILEDKEVEFAKFEMSTTHPRVDICDYYANLDVGYGRGVVPKDQMITLPLHPHCKCRYKPHYRRVKKREVKDSERETIEKFTKDQQRMILGSEKNLQKFYMSKMFGYQNSIEKIFNESRPKYPIEKFIDVLSITAKGIVSKEETLRQIVKKLEKIKTHEEIYGIDGDGNKLFHKKGGQSSVNITDIEDKMKNADTVIHNHPHNTSYSGADVAIAVNNNVQNMRVTSELYDYNLQINFDFFDIHGPRASDVAYDIYTDIDDKLFSRYAELTRSGKMSAEDARIKHTHETMLEFAKRTGSIYTREAKK